MTELDLYPGAKPCVRSGYCCKSAPCGFGEPTSESNRACRFLEGGRPGEYHCGKAEEIVQDPSWVLSPAFGAGCCSPMNTDRLEVR